MVKILIFCLILSMSSCSIFQSDEERFEESIKPYWEKKYDEQLDYASLSPETIPKGETLISYIEKVFNNHRINRISISNIDLSLLPDRFDIFDTLKKISITRYNSAEVNWQELIKKIKRSNGLRILYLNSNKIDSLPEAITELTSIEEIDLRGNCIKYFPDSIWKLSNLKEVLISRCDLDHLPLNIEKIISLEDLHIELYKKLDLRNAIKTLAKLPKLNTFALFESELDSIPEEIKSLKELNTLYLDQNRIKYLPESIGEMKNLRRIQIYNNPLRKLPESFKHIEHKLIISGCPSHLRLPELYPNIIF